MSSKVGKFLSNIWHEQRVQQKSAPKGGLDDINPLYGGLEPYSLGTYYGEELERRDRKTIYTIYKIMMQDPTIHAALNLLTAAALGGHESRGEIVFITPSDKVMGNGLNAKRLRKLVQKEAEHLQNLLNSIIFTLCRNAIGYGDGYMRIYPQDGLGIMHVLCNEQLDPPLIQAYERAGKTVAFHVLEITDQEVRRISKLGRHQMLRMKMQRTTPLPQFRLDNLLNPQLLQEDDLNKVAVVPAPIGGSFLQPVEKPWRDWALNFTALNTQQIADSVNNQFLTLDMSGMPEASRMVYKTGLKEALKKQQEKTRKALTGGKELFETNWTFLPTWGEKQVLTPLGDLTKRTAPMSLELVMTHLKRGIGALGLDLSLVGWMELITGGLGDGGAFHTSAQVGTLSALIRQCVSDTLIDFCIIHFAYKYGEVFTRENLPFKIEFYSDISAAATEALNSKNTRANTTSITAATVQQIKDLNLGRSSNLFFFEDLLGIDQSKAVMLADDMEAAQKKAEAQMNNEHGSPDPADDDDSDLNEDIE